MGINFSKLKLNRVSSNRNLRLDNRFLEYSKTSIQYNYNNFSNFIIEIGNGKDILPSNYVDFNESNTVYPTVNNFKKGKLNYNDILFLEDSCQIFKNLENDDIIISRSGTVGLTYAWNNEELSSAFERNIIAIPSGYLIIVKVKKEQVNPKFIQYLFNSSIFKYYFYVFGVGKTQKNIAQPEILSIPFPSISLTNQNDLVSKINPIEKEIQELNTQIQQPLSIINDTFSSFYGYDKNLWKAFGKGMTAGTQKSDERSFKYYKIASKNVAKSSILRFSSRFHSPLTVELENILEKKDTIRIKDITIEIVKGIQPKYIDKGDIAVTKITNLKNGYIDFSEPEYVSQSFFDSQPEKVKLKYGDVIICCTGKISLGKIDFYDLAEESILTVDNYILRIDEKKYNSLFMTYFLRSILGAFQIEREYTGTTNQIHLYANEIANFKIPNISLTTQEKIVNEIKEKLDAQKAIEAQIETKQQEISEIIVAAIR